MEAKLQQQAPQKAQTNKPNLTGIPTQMKLDFEQRSGLSFDDVRVHYNSDKPAQLQALAYTQGTQVYVGPGQERHLPHELGHVVQQKTGLVRPTKIQNGISINDSPRLEELANQVAMLPINSHIIRTNNNTQIVVQRKQDLVSVSLMNRDSLSHEYNKKDIIVYSISLPQRFPTGLLGKKTDTKKSSDTEIPQYAYNKSQGSHTIADVFVKWAQRKSVTGQSLDEALCYYKTETNSVKNQTQKVLDRKEVKECEDECKSPLDNFPASIKKRFIEALSWSEVASEQIETAQESTKRLISDWSVLFKNIIYAYNMAYAHSPYATQGFKGTFGCGEQTDMAFLSETRKRMYKGCTDDKETEPPKKRKVPDTLLMYNSDEAKTDGAKTKPAKEKGISRLFDYKSAEAIKVNDIYDGDKLKDFNEKTKRIEKFLSGNPEIKGILEKIDRATNEEGDVEIPVAFINFIELLYKTPFEINPYTKMKHDSKESLRMSYLAPKKSQADTGKAEATTGDAMSEEED